MYLISVLMGYDSSFRPGFEVEKDKWGITNIVMRETNRRIRIVGDFEDGALKPVEKQAETPNEEITIHEIDGYKIAYNPKNMNLNIFNTSKSKQYKKRLSLPFENDSLLYLTLNANRYRLVNYILHDGARIVQTYKHSDKDTGISYVGAAISFNTDTTSTNTKREGVISCMLYDITDDNYYLAVVNLYGNVNTITYHIRSITDPTTIGVDSGAILTKPFDHLIKDLKHGVSFKISDTDKIITNYIITNKDDIPDEYIDDSIEHVSVIKVNDDDIIVSTNDKKSTVTYSKELEENLMNTILKDNVRALTTVGVRIPKDFCPRYKILYLFTYDEKNGSKCIKSV